MLVILLLPYIALALIGSDEQLIGFFPDDAFYYLKTAKNFWAMGYPTFDGINPTNGFHPLYFLLVTLIVGIVPGSGLLGAVFMVHTLLIGFALSLLVRPTMSLNSPWSWILLALLAIPAPFLFIWVSAGMEAPLVMLGTILFLDAWICASKEYFNNLKDNFYLGMAITVLMLSRLDNILVIPPFILVFLMSIQKSSTGNLGRKFKNAAAALTIPSIAGTIYIGVNILTTGHLVPISAAVKATFFIPFDISWQASTFNNRLPMTLLAIFPPIVALASLLLVSFRDQPASRYERIALSLAAVSILIYYVYLRFFASNFFGWYFAMPLAATGWLVIRGLIWYQVLPEHFMRFSERFPKTLPAAALVIAFVTNVGFVYYLANVSKSITWHLMQIAKKLDEAVSPDAIAGTYDAGAIGYFSKAKVINLDGLANNYPYFENYRRSHRISEYFADQNVTVFLLRDEHAINHSEVLSGSYGKARFAPDLRLELLARSELFRYSIPGNFTVIAYRYPPGEEDQSPEAD